MGPAVASASTPALTATAALAAGLGMSSRVSS